jgi:hypothetical protein
MSRLLSRRRLAVVAAIGVLVTLTAAIWLPSMARAASNITVISAGPDASGDPYDLTVVMDDANGLPITSMTAHVFDDNSNDVADPAMTCTGSDPTDQTCTPNEAIPQADLPAGTYTVTVDATDADESPTGLAAPSPFSFSYTTTMTVVASPTFVTEGSQSVTFTGSVTGEAPGGTGPSPISGAAVDLSISSGPPNQVATSDGSGNFSTTVSDIQSNADYNFSVAGSTTGLEYSPTSQDITVDAQQSATSVSVQATPTAVTQGQQDVVFTGTVTAVQPGMGNTVPVTNAPVSLSISGGSPISVGNTDGSGDFSYTASDVTANADYNFSVTGTPMYTVGNSDITVDVNQATTDLSVTASPATVTQGATTVTFTGTAEAVPPTPPGGSSSPLPSGTTINVTLPDGSPDTATVGSDGTFSYTATNVTGATNAFTFAVAGTNLYSSDSTTVTVDAAPAATTVAVTPTTTTVTNGSTSVTFNGTVTTAAPPGISQPPVVAGAQVYLNGSPLSGVTTDASGDFSYTTDVTQTSTFSFSVPAGVLYQASPNDNVTITANAAATTITATATTTVNPGMPEVSEGYTTVSFSGSATAGGSPVSGAQVDLNGSALSGVTTDASGDFSYSTTATQTTTFSFSVPATPLYTQPTAASVTVTAVQATTNLTVTASPDKVGIGSQTVTFTGSLTATPSGAKTVGVPGATIDLNGTALPGTTDANGNFSYTLDNASPADYTFTTPSEVLYTAGSDTVPVGINQAHTNLTVTSSRATVTEGATTVTFSGTLTGAVPGVTTQSPIGSAPIDLAIGKGKSAKVATTNSAGDFSATVSGISDTTDYNFSLTSTSNYAAATYVVSITAIPARTSIIGLSLSPPRLKYGQKTTLKGTVRYLYGKTWRTLGGVKVHLRVGTSTLRAVNSARSGSFSAVLPSKSGPAWSAAVSASPLIHAVTANGNLTVAVPLKITAFSASLNVLANVGASGCLQVTVPDYRGPQTAVEIQYASNPRGHWTELGTIRLHNVVHASAACRRSSQAYFSGSLHAKLANAYYRAYFPGNPDYVSALSGSIHSARTATKISSFSLSPRTVKYKQVVTITGRLWRDTSKGWAPYGNRLIEFFYTQKGTKFTRPLGTTHTNSGGYFKQQAQGGSGNFIAVIQAVYPGSSTDLEAASPVIDLRIDNGKEVP